MCCVCPDSANVCLVKTVLVCWRIEKRLYFQLQDLQNLNFGFDFLSWQPREEVLFKSGQTFLPFTRTIECCRRQEEEEPRAQGHIGIQNETGGTSAALCVQLQSLLSYVVFLTNHFLLFPPKSIPFVSETSRGGVEPASWWSSETPPSPHCGKVHPRRTKVSKVIFQIRPNELIFFKFYHSFTLWRVTELLPIIHTR